MIFGSIKNWGFSANEKFIKMFEGFKEEICLLNPYFNIIQNKDIQEVIKYRNDITHGSHRILNQKIGITAQAMASLVYCYLLSRIGLSKEQIKELCSNNKLLQ